MGIEITVDIHPDYIIVRSSGRFTPGAYEQTVRTVIDAVLIYDRPRVLIDATGVTGSVPQGDRTGGPAYLVEQANLLAPGRILRLAFVCGEAQFDPQRRGQSIANTGGISTCVFTDIEQAAAWLAQ